MANPTLNWIFFFILAYVIMFIIIPPEEGPRLSPFGFWMGIVQAIVVLLFGQTVLKLFRLVGDPTLIGIPILTTLSWGPPAIVFVRFLSFQDNLLERVVLIGLFAAGAALAQIVLEFLGMWQSLRFWSPFWTFVLALGTHSVMTIYYVARYEKYLDYIRKN